MVGWAGSIMVGWAGSTIIGDDPEQGEEGSPQQHARRGCQEVAGGGGGLGGDHEGEGPGRSQQHRQFGGGPGVQAIKFPDAHDDEGGNQEEYPNLPPPDGGQQYGDAHQRGERPQGKVLVEREGPPPQVTLRAVSGDGGTCRAGRPVSRRFHAGCERWQSYLPGTMLPKRRWRWAKDSRASSNSGASRSGQRVGVW